MVLFSSLAAQAQCGKYYVQDMDPWSSTSNQQAMDQVFGTGAWTQANYSTSVATVFSPSNCFVVLEGSDNNPALTSYITNNQAVIENWVAAGGRLFINSAPNTGSTVGPMFGGVSIVYPDFSGTGSAPNTSHPIFLGPNTPTATSWTGGSYCHANVTGTGLTSIMDGDPGKMGLGYKLWGSGVVFFGGMTQPQFWSPQPESYNMWNNIFHHVWNFTLTDITASIGASTYCGGATDNVTYTSTGVTFNTGNVFSVELSDAAGSFSTPTTIGTLSSTSASGSIAVTIPTGIGGTGYRIRVVSSNTAYTGSNNGSNIAISNVSVVSNSQTNVLCNGGTGSASVTAGNGTGSYTYAWSPSGGTASSATGLSAGNYTVTVTDANATSCTATQAFTITEPAVLTLTPSSTNETPCNNSNNGTASVTMTGGTAPYTYSWSTGATTSGITGLVAGSYTVNVTDNNLCAASHTFTITEPTVITGIPSQTNVSCNGGSNGTATVIAQGGGSPFYAYSWAPTGGTGTTASGLSAGNYTVTITNGFGCTGTQTYTITEPTAISIAPSQTNVLCNGASTGTATATVTGGSGFYSYSWAPTGGTGSTALNLAAGTYTVSVTDFNFCSASQTYTITQPTALTLTSGGQTNITCNGGNNGSATVSVSGGTGAYTYSWSPNGGTAATANNLTAGMYTVTVTDANNCQGTLTYNITQPAAMAATGSQTNVSCFGGANGSATVAATGGTLPYTYSWAPSGGTAATANGLSAGNYTVTVSDFNGCSVTHTYTITQPSQISTLGVQTNVSCFGGANGSATVLATGGTGAYTYSWAPAGGTGTTANGLAAGTYTVTVTDANLCTATRTYNITEPAQMLTNATVTNVSCFGLGNGSITTAMSGGVAPYSYYWTPNGQTAASISNLVPGSYAVIVTDANACNITQNFTITQPTVLTASGTQTNVSCFGGANGTATAIPAGGTAPYSYSWAPTGGTAATATGLTAGNYTATVTDFNGCTTTQTYTITEPTQLVSVPSQVNVSCNSGSDGSASVAVSGGVAPYTYVWAPTGGTAATASNLVSAVYTVTITDFNGCTLVNTFNISQPTYLSTTGTQVNVSCNGAADASATVIPAGGTPGYTYSWAPTGGTAATASNLVPGTYTVTVTDANGCTAIRTYNVTEPAVLVSSGAQSNVLCNGGASGAASITAVGGTLPYSYDWQPGGMNTPSVTGLVAGTYTATVTDANGCITAQTYTISEPTAITYQASQSNVLCNGGASGTATIAVAGGVAPYTYNWLPTGGTAATETGLTAGTYTVNVTDDNGCMVSEVYTITEPATLTVFATANSPVCSGQDLNLTGTVAGGTAPYSMSWYGPNNYSSSMAISTISNVQVAAAGTYTFSVTDNNGCVSSALTAVAVNETPQVTTQPQPVTACFGTSASFSVTAIGTGISYQWRANGANIPNTGVYSGANTNTLNISDVTGLNGIVYDVIVSGVCTPDTSIGVTLTAPSFNTWTGTVDTAWSNAANWQCGIVPTLVTDAIIPASAPKMPLVDIPGAQANSVTINSGASLAFVGTGNELEIVADITNLGTFNPSLGAVKLSGTGAQSIPGGTYAELELAGSGVKTTTGNIAITGALLLNGGYLQLGANNLTLTATGGVSGGDASSFVVTNGTGVFIAQGLGNGGIIMPVTFPVGTTPGIYTPASILNSGTIDNFSVRVIENVYSDYVNEVPVGGALSSNSVKKTWFINEAVDGGSNAVVSLSWPLSEELPGFNNSLSDVSHYIEDSSNWSSGPVSQATGTTTLFTQSRPNVTSFSPFGLGTQNNPLSVSAVTLAGVYNVATRAVDLTWDKSNDKDVIAYSVERSLNGTSYKAIGNRYAGEDTYTLSDVDAMSLGTKQLYYRVRVLSNDGYVYSNTVKVDLGTMLVTHGMTLYPNPVAGSELFVSLTNNALATDMEVSVVDMLGKEVSKAHYEAGSYNPAAIPVNVSDLAQGLYTIRVKQAGTSAQMAKFTKK
ncbi:MAG: T9SS type A sorting domain-containing protein [Flavipsychrobacter sp.]|nr:T9SS type A sorting domain-containing protein [Flavipsychrobacter sp.]